MSPNELSTPSSSTSTKMYKGKVTRSWGQLPPELVRLTASFVLMDLAASGALPRSWDSAQLWSNRAVLAALRDVNRLQELMRVCPQWYKAIEHHLFWQRALGTIDPQDVLARWAVIHPSPKAAGTAAVAAPVRLTPCAHLHNILNHSCMVCRVNRPWSQFGMGEGKPRTGRSLTLGPVTLCREHRRATAWCAICLRDAPPVENVAAFHAVGCVENEDVDTWPGADATCRSCRQETLWRHVANNPRDRAAVGGHRFEPEDWEARQAIEAFLDLGEGTIKDVLALCAEKQWLRAHTKVAEYSGQAMAASRLQAREAAVAGYESEEEALSEDEDDPELIALTEDAAGVRELALTDWARTRILDGHWLSPADQWYQNAVAGKPAQVSAEHPCPYETYGAEYDERWEHPLPATLNVGCPPTYTLCEQAYRVYCKQMKQILQPAMSNVVRRIVIECAADGSDPIKRVSAMSLDEVGGQLRDKRIWYNGFDWGKAERVAHHTRAYRESRHDSDSDSSITTSPVLSTSTLQTTPSPPPVKNVKPTALAIPVQANVEHPVSIHSIPFIPTMISHFPYYTALNLQNIWREACSPLYHCRCRICDRAMANASGGAPQIPPRPTAPVRAQAPEREVPSKDVDHEKFEQEGHIVLLDPYEENPAAVIEIEDEEKQREEEPAQKDELPILVTPRKRRSNDLHDENAPTARPVRVRESTPMKRARLDTPPHIYDGKPLPLVPSTPKRTRKRSTDKREDEDDSLDIQRHRKRTSEELRSEGGTTSEEEGDLAAGHKRARVRGKLEVVTDELEYDPAKAPRSIGSPAPTLTDATKAEVELKASPLPEVLEARSEVRT